MSDYFTQVGISRDEIADLVAGNIEQAPYVLANIAKRIHPETCDFDDFCDGVQALDEDEQVALLAFCIRLADAIEPASRKP